MADSGIGVWGIPLAIVAGAVRVSTPFIFVSLGECITEKSGRINLGLEGILVMGAMVGYGVSGSMVSFLPAAAAWMRSCNPSSRPERPLLSGSVTPSTWAASRPSG